MLKTFFKDADEDGYVGTTQTQSCSVPKGYAAESGDCNDYNKAIHPGAAEACNDVDDDCDGTVDNDLPTQTKIGRAHV